MATRAVQTARGIVEGQLFEVANNKRRPWNTGASVGMGPPGLDGFFGWVAFGGVSRMTWLDTAAPLTMVPERLLRDLDLRVLPGRDRATLDVVLPANFSGQDLDLGILPVVVADNLERPVLGMDALSRIWFAWVDHQERPSEFLWLFSRRSIGKGPAKPAS